ncbi:MAG: AAA family ATPase [Candidatus Binatia bacterium]
MSFPEPIQAMLRPEMYPYRPATVDFVQTHISYVFLAGDEVYKVKKPVHFSFVDFSTLERRRHFCHEEVRLNRRLAPHVYIGVVAICRAGVTYRLGSEGDDAAVEYAVRMRRLPADRTLDQLLDRGEVTLAMIDQLARRLADFHRRADAGPHVTANGDVAAIAAVLEDNFAGMRPFHGVTIAAAEDDAIQEFSRDFLRRQGPLFRRRQAEHRIRDCHGDLHSEHICFDGEPVIFDCIEFNPKFRYCDTASEIAFLAMDLDYHGRAELARHLVSFYAAHADDPELPGLVPFYQCHRAYVRGKVDSLKSAEEEVEPAERERARASAQRHFALAYRYTWAYGPCLVMIAGLSGTGKSAVAGVLAARTGFVHINSDVVRKRLAGLAAESRVIAAYESGLYSPEYSRRTYAAMLAEAAELLGAGRGVVFDATFQRRTDRDTVRALAHKHAVPSLLVECHCREDEVRRRLEARQGRGGASDADWNVYLEQRRRYEAIGSDERDDTLLIDTTVPLPEVAASVERALRPRTEPPPAAMINPDPKFSR